MLYGVNSLVESLFDMKYISKLESNEVDFYFQIGEKGMYGYDLIHEIMETEENLTKEIKNLGFFRVQFVCGENAEEYSNGIYTIRIRNAVFANN